MLWGFEMFRYQEPKKQTLGCIHKDTHIHTHKCRAMSLYRHIYNYFFHPNMECIHFEIIIRNIYTERNNLFFLKRKHYANHFCEYQFYCIMLDLNRELCVYVIKAMQQRVKYKSYLWSCISFPLYANMCISRII